MMRNEQNAGINPKGIHAPIRKCIEKKTIRKGRVVFPALSVHGRGVVMKRNAQRAVGNAHPADLYARSLCESYFMNRRLFSMEKNKRNMTLRLCLVAIFAALYFVLTSWLTIRIGNLRISVASLPILILAIMYGPIESCTAAVLGEFIYQVLNYGITLTTPLWLLPPVIRALIVAFGYRMLKKKGTEPWKESPVSFVLLLVAAAIATTLANTGITWLDSVIYHYYSFAYVFGDFVVRLLTGIGTAVVMSIILPPVVTALRRID